MEQRASQVIDLRGPLLSYASFFRTCLEFVNSLHLAQWAHVTLTHILLTYYKCQNYHIYSQRNNSQTSLFFYFSYFTFDSQILTIYPNRAEIPIR